MRDIIKRYRISERHSVIIARRQALDRHGHFDENPRLSRAIECRKAMVLDRGFRFRRNRSST